MNTKNLEELNQAYSEQYDAFYDTKTGEWLESKCDDPNCEYCSNRPEKYEGEK